MLKVQSKYQLATSHDSRRSTKIHKLFTDKVTAINWQDFAENSLNITEQQDVIINLCGANIGAKRWSKKRKQEILNSRIQPTQTLAHVCAQLKEQAPRLLNASAIGIYGLQDNR